MRYGRILQVVALTLAIACVPLALAPAVSAETSSSPNFKVTETEFGSGSSAETCKGQYCMRGSIGNMVAGTSGTASFGPITPDIPTLEVIVAAGPEPSHLGVLTTEQTATKTMTVKVRSYLSNGYFLQIAGNTPTYSGHSLAALGSPTAAAAGTEQFGINAVANTSPTNFGANAVQVPSSEFSYGTVEPNYSTPNLYMYQPGGTVARSLVASGQTDYTISMIINVANNTPAGLYSTEFSAVVIPMY